MVEVVVEWVDMDEEVVVDVSVVTVNNYVSLFFVINGMCEL